MQKYEPTPADIEKVKRNARVQARYDALMAGGRHGHYETMFKVVREEVEAERERCAAIADKRAEVWNASLEAGVHEPQCAMSLAEECEDIALAIRGKIPAPMARTPGQSGRD